MQSVECLDWNAVR